jgi:transposase InsO family protein
MLVAVDKFTKWVEAAPVTTQDSTVAINFIKSIVFCFRVPHSIITDNGTNFTSKEFKSYCESMGIKLKFAFVAHPKSNGQVEKANGLICNGIKKRLLAPLEKALQDDVDALDEARDVALARAMQYQQSLRNYHSSRVRP